MSEPDGVVAGAGTPGSTADPRTPLLVVHQDATAEEVAAIVAALAALAPAPAPARRPRSRWNHPERLVRRTLPHGPGGWTASGLPR